MAKLNPQQYAAKWQARTRGAVPDFVQGVNSVTESPGMKAAARADAYRAGVERSLAEGKWQQRVAAVPLQEWKEKTANLGAQRIGTGVDAAAPRMQQFAAELLPFQESLKAQLDQSSPRGDLEQNLARSQAWIRGMSKFRKT